MTSVMAALNAEDFCPSLIAPGNTADCFIRALGMCAVLSWRAAAVISSVRCARSHRLRDAEVRLCCDIMSPAGGTVAAMGQSWAHKLIHFSFSLGLKPLNPINCTHHMN